MPLPSSEAPRSATEASTSYGSSEPGARALYMSLCINCGGPVEDLRSLHKNACSACMASPQIVTIREPSELLRYVAKPSERLKSIVELLRRVKEFEEFFTKCVSSDMWSLQRTWAYRVFQGQSFAMIAPTGIGKTTFGLVLALFLAYKHGKKVYILVPTSVLVEQYAKRLNEYAQRAGITVSIIAVHSRLTPKKRAELESAIKSGSFDIVITTSLYLHRNFGRVFLPLIERGQKIDLIYADDVDAIMKGSKVIEFVLRLLGFEEEDIITAYKVLSLRLKALRCAQGRGPSEERCLEGGKSLEDYLAELTLKLADKRAKSGLLIISSATGRARGRRTRLFKELLGFTIGSSIELYRNVVDSYTIEGGNIIESLVALIQRLGPGGLIYVPQDLGVEYANQLVKELRAKGVEAELVVSKRSKALNEFLEGKLKVIIGIATYYGLLVRGLDAPERVRYAIFVGVPRHKILMSKIEYNPITLMRLLSALLEVVDERDKAEILKHVTRLSRVLRRLSAERMAKIIEALRAGEPVDGDPAASLTLSAHRLVTALISRYDIMERLKKSPNLAVVEERGQLYMLLPDAATYIQASGRTSRLFAGGITKGLSVVLVDDERLLRGLERRLRLYIDDFKFYPLSDVNLDEVLKQIDEDRELVRLVRLGIATLKEAPQASAKKPHAITSLFIVESPNKARTIASFFGRPTVRDYGVLRVYEVDIGERHITVTASGGHIFELVEEGLSHDSIYGVKRVRSGAREAFLPKYDFIKRCLKCGTQFVKGNACPRCGSALIKSSKDVVEALQRLAMEVDEVIIATDPDAEGEKIAYDLAVALAPYAKRIKRAEFHEVTRRAILSSLNNLRDVALKLVEAQITRRIEDRWLGFALSEYVTKMYKGLEEAAVEEFRYSAGRVQTPVLGEVIERMIMRLLSLRKSKLLWLLDDVVIEVPVKHLEAVLGDKAKRLRPRDVGVALKPIMSYIDALNPPPPFTTDELLAEAQRVLGFDAPTTMNFAQDLFESGLITYHRTDSTRISATGMAVARDYLLSTFASHAERLFNPRSWGEGGAHEGIRPTRPLDAARLREMLAEGIVEFPARFTNRHLKLYDLIFRRFIASQMRGALVEKTLYVAEVYVESHKVWTQALEVVTNVVEPGFLLMYSPFRVKVLPKAEMVLSPYRVKTTYRSDSSLPTQGDLVKWMREVGIGRPSTYAKIVDTIVRRGYVYSTKGGVLIPSLRGIMVYSLLAGNLYPGGRYDVLAVLPKYVQLYGIRRATPGTNVEEAVRMIEKALRNARDDIASMVSVHRTELLYKKMQQIESGGLDYTSVLHEVLSEICSNLIPLIYGDYLKEVC